jgi:hypothetical protein
MTGITPSEAVEDSPQPVFLSRAQKRDAGRYRLSGSEIPLSDIDESVTEGDHSRSSKRVKASSTQPGMDQIIEQDVNEPRGCGCVGYLQVAGY